MKFDTPPPDVVAKAEGWWTNANSHYNQLVTALGKQITEHTQQWPDGSDPATVRKVMTVQFAMMMSDLIAATGDPEAHFDAMAVNPLTGEEVPLPDDAGPDEIREALCRTLAELLAIAVFRGAQNPTDPAQDEIDALNAMFAAAGYSPAPASDAEQVQPQADETSHDESVDYTEVVDAEPVAEPGEMLPGCRVRTEDGRVGKLKRIDGDMGVVAIPGEPEVEYITVGKLEVIE